MTRCSAFKMIQTYVQTRFEYIRCTFSEACWQENAVATDLYCISNWKEILRKPHPSDLHLFPYEPANQHSHGTG